MRVLRRLLPTLIPSLVLFLALVLRYFDPGGLLLDFRTTVFDYYQRFAPREYVEAPVRIVDIDDESLLRLGMQWPWPRIHVAEMVSTLANSGAAAIVFDIVFAEPDRTSPGNIGPVWALTSDISDLRAQLERLPDHDQLLAEAIGAAGSVVTGFILTSEVTGKKPVVRGTFALAGDDPKPFLRGYYRGAVTSLDILEEAATGNGTFNFSPGSDLVTRTVPLVLALGDQLYPSITAEALRVAQGARTYIIKSSGASGETGFGESTGVNHIKIGDFIVPTNAHGEITVHYTRHRPERYLPAWKLFSSDFDPDEVAGQIILIGTSASGLRDIRPSPINPVMPGVEAHAQAIEQIILGHFLKRPDWTEGVEWLFVLSLGIGLILLLGTLGALWSAIIGFTALLGAFGASWYSYRELLLLFDPVTPSITALLIYLSGSLIGYLRTEAEKKQVRGAFAQYLSPALVEQLAADPSRLKLGGETRNMTFLFCDVRGFTTVSEQFKSNPQGLTQLINRFLTPMTDAILERRGTIDKYMGDCIMAFWNAPLANPRHADDACESALAMLERLKLLNAALEAEARAENRPFHPLNIGIGLNTGDCVVGNMGSQQRFDYSVLGDAVNLASRLEGQSKTYGVDVVIGESTRQAAKNWACIELDLIAVKGKKEAVRIFALLGDASVAQSAEFREIAARQDAMLAAYRRQDWAEAERLARDGVARAGHLGELYELYLERIAYFRDNPPGADWDGVFVATSK
ncbi:MAG: adenylate/guanylate cyclase domain-containing protein [Alphaproteobacteria bacterium]|nr:adenylate/guanylate cyclase domain-containing protein [Alphaproteobacteria bacterium]